MHDARVIHCSSRGVVGLLLFIKSGRFVNFSIVGFAAAPDTSSQVMMLSWLAVRPALRPALLPPATGVLRSASMSALNLEERYATIAEGMPKQRAAYTKWVASEAVDGPALAAAASAVGIRLDVAGGQISYASDFEAKRVPLAFDLIYCRHGKTTGNTEPRVYQGFVDEPQNALNEIGLQQEPLAPDLALAPSP